jgi:hypothetical protein
LPTWLASSSDRTKHLSEGIRRWYQRALNPMSSRPARATTHSSRLVGALHRSAARDPRGYSNS